MTCELFDEHAMDALSREADPAMTDAVLAHIRCCEPCRARWDELTRAAELLAAQRPEPGRMPDMPAFWDRVDARRTPASPTRRWVAAAALLVAVGAMLTLGTRVEYGDGQLAIVFGQSSTPPAPADDPGVDRLSTRLAGLEARVTQLSAADASLLDGIEQVGDAQVEDYRRLDARTRQLRDVVDYLVRENQADTAKVGQAQPAWPLNR